MWIIYLSRFFFFFFFNDTATTEIYTLSLHDALPICRHSASTPSLRAWREQKDRLRPSATRDRKSTRLNSSHSQISYAVFCLKKKKKKKTNHTSDNLISIFDSTYNTSPTFTYRTLYKM